MASETKSELVDELSSHSTKAELVELLGSRLKKDEISKLLDDDSEGTKDELLHKLGLRKKDELVQAVESRLTKDEIEKAVDAVRDDTEEDHVDDSGSDDGERDEPSAAQRKRDAQQRDEGRQHSRHADDSDLDWNAQLDWAPAPQPTPAPVAYAGAAPYLPGARVRVDLSGLPLLGVFLGKGASAAGTIVGVNAHERSVRVYLDACFDGEKEILLPPERVLLDR
jgi:hypothetical protein